VQASAICVAISADGQRIATGSNDATARLWDAKTGAQIAALGPLAGRVTSVAFSPLGDRVATGAGTTARIWDPTTGKQIGTARPHAGPVLAVAISPDGRLLASGGRDPRIRISQLGAETEPSFLRGHKGAVTSIAFSGDGARIVASSSDGQLYEWETASGELIGAARMYSEAVLGMAIAAKGARVVTRSDDNTARISTFFNNTASLVDQAKNTVPRCLTAIQMNKFHLGEIPPRWCITGSGHEQETDSTKWQPRWPYDTPEWRQWLGAIDRGEQVAPPPR
jgi:WD40 repeat protein